MMNLFNEDIPIENSSEDRLRREEFAGSLAKSLIKYQTQSSFCVGLYGKWGSGKSSLLNMIIEKTREIDNKCKIIRFEPWLCNDSTQMISQFFVQMRDVLKYGNSDKEIVNLLTRYASLIEFVKYIPTFGDVLSKALETVGDVALKDAEEREGNLQGIRNKIAEYIKNKNIRLIITIDDIDRLSKEEIISVFQLVKALGSFPNTIYLLAFDYDVVVRALEDVQRGNGKEYLEKIIQIPFEIPMADPIDIQNIFLAKLYDVLGDKMPSSNEQLELMDIIMKGISPYIKTIRDINRYINVLSIKYVSMEDELNLIDLLGVTCLQVFEPEIYSSLPFYKDILCGTISPEFRTNGEKDKKIGEAADALVFKNSKLLDQDSAEYLLGTLFPVLYITKHFSDGLWSTSTHTQCLIGNKISAKECFQRYFTMRLENDAIPMELFKKVICEYVEIDIKEFIVQVCKDNKIDRFLSMTIAYIEKEIDGRLSQDRAFMLFKCMTQMMEGIINVDDEFFFSTPRIWRFNKCIEDLLLTISADQRYDCIESVFRDDLVSLSVKANLLRNIGERNGRYTENESVASNKIIQETELDVLEQEFCKLIRSTLSDIEKIKNCGNLNFLWMVDRVDPDLAQLANDKLKVYAKESNAVLSLVVKYATTEGKRKELSGSKVQKTYKVDLSEISKYDDLQEAARRLYEYMKTDEYRKLSTDMKETVKAFLAFYELKEKGELHSRYITEDKVEAFLNNGRISK